MKMTFQPKKRSRAKVHGFRARMSTKGCLLYTSNRRIRPWYQASARLWDHSGILLPQPAYLLL